MAWFTPAEQILRPDPGITDQHWGTTWLPQIIAQNTKKIVDWISLYRRRGRR